MPHLALFDLDNTLLLGDSDYSWGEYLCDNNIVDPKIFRQKNKDYYQDYLDGKLDTDAYYQFCLEPLVHNPVAQMEALRKAYIQEIIEPMISSQARALVNYHKSKGDVCAIITATQSFVTAPIAELFEIKHLIATDPEKINGSYTGKVEGVPCIREKKLEKLNLWMSRNGFEKESFEHITAYSDSFNDLPLLQLADTAVAVNPDETLAKHAQLHGWQILHFS